MGGTEDQAKARAIQEFDRAIQRMKVPRFGLNSVVSVSVDLPSLEGLRHDNRANIKFGNKDVSLKIARTSDGAAVQNGTVEAMESVEMIPTYYSRKGLGV